MNPLLIDACTQADNRIAAALGAACPVKSRLSQRGTVANPAPRVLRRDGEQLAGAIDLADSWFQAVTADGGYLNFTLSLRWYQSAVEAPPPVGKMVNVPGAPVEFSAEIVPEDWYFWKALKGRSPDPAIAARRDRENPGWLVRYTARRLEELEPRAAETIRWTEEERALMLELSRYPQGAQARTAAGYLLGLAQQVWEAGPQKLPAALNRHCQRVLAAGRAELGGQFV